jgi:hypothetical protein
MSFDKTEALIDNKIIKGLYIDDQTTYFQFAKNALYDTNFELNFRTDIEIVIKECKNNYHSFLICDLKLDRLTTMTDGYKILVEVREMNKQIFLALLTSYEYILSKEQKELLKKKQIENYSKDDLKAFALNFKRDYKRLEEYNRFADILVNDLENIVGPKIKISVSKNLSLTTSELAIEIKKRSDIGQQFLNSWIRGKIKRKKK